VLQLLLTPVIFVVLLAVRHLMALYVRSPAGAWIRRWNLHIFESQTEAYRARLADRLARGEDRYFEELREIQTYAPPPPMRDGKGPDYSWRTLIWLGCVAFFLAPDVISLLHLGGKHV
jgi:hypothetical protein